MKKGENMKLPIVLTRRVLIAGATVLSMAMTPLSAMADDVKVAGIFTLPVDQQWISRIHIALDAAQERGDIEYVYSENVGWTDLYSKELILADHAEFLTEDVLKVNASLVKLKKEDIANMHKGDLEVIRNSIYARHGYSFKNRKMRYIFDDNVDWYIPLSTDIRDQLTEIEIANNDLLKRYLAK